MSVIACRILENGFEIGADSIKVRSYTKTTTNGTFVKLFEVNDIVIGSAGAAEETGLMYLFAKTHSPGVCSEEAILEYMSEFADWKNKKTGNYGIENHYIIGFQKRAFLVQDRYPFEITTYESIGMGMDYALAALYLGHNVEKAVEVAIELSVYCEEPISVIEK